MCVKTKVALDLDGVIWDLIDSWLKRYNLLYDDNVTSEDIKEYELSKSLTKATCDEIKSILSEKDFWDTVVPFKYSIKYLRKLNSEFDLYIATATNYKIFDTKVERLLALFPFLDKHQIICIHNKSLLDVDWLVDDCVDNLRHGKFNKIILDAPYNRDCNDFIRARNLKEVYNIINTGEYNL